MAISNAYIASLRGVSIENDQKQKPIPQDTIVIKDFRVAGQDSTEVDATIKLGEIEITASRLRSEYIDENSAEGKEIAQKIEATEDKIAKLRGIIKGQLKDKEQNSPKKTLHYETYREDGTLKERFNKAILFTEYQEFQKDGISLKKELFYSDDERKESGSISQYSKDGTLEKIETFVDGSSADRYETAKLNKDGTVKQTEATFIFDQSRGTSTWDASAGIPLGYKDNTDKEIEVVESKTKNNQRQEQRFKVLLKDRKGR